MKAAHAIVLTAVAVGFTRPGWDDVTSIAHDVAHAVVTNPGLAVGVALAVSSVAIIWRSWE